MSNRFEKLINGITERHVHNKTKPRQASKRRYNPLFVDSELIVCNKRERGCKRERVSAPLPKEMMSLESEDSDDEPRIRPKKLHGGPGWNNFLSENEDEEEHVNPADSFCWY
jgi:hypothetical protein